MLRQSAAVPGGPSLSSCRRQKRRQIVAGLFCRSDTTKLQDLISFLRQLGLEKDAKVAVLEGC